MSRQNSNVMDKLDISHDTGTYARDTNFCIMLDVDLEV